MSGVLEETTVPQKTEITKKVEQYLNKTSYVLDTEYVPSEFALEFINFIKLVNGEEGEEHASPVIHYRMLDQLVYGGSNVCNMCARGTAKTTLLAEYLFLYLAVYGKLPEFGKINLALYVSDSIENGVKNMHRSGRDPALIGHRRGKPHLRVQACGETLR